MNLSGGFFFDDIVDSLSILLRVLSFLGIFSLIQRFVPIWWEKTETDLKLNLSLISSANTHKQQPQYAVVVCWLVV